MLRSVLADYLANIKNERDFDLPLVTLLPAMGFDDVHYTHGHAEFGKDFIAKRIEKEAPIQYSLQLKAGDISQGEFRDHVMPQMMESILVGLSHPSFDKSLQHQAVLVTTGRLVGNAAIELQGLNEKIAQLYKARPVIVWDQETLKAYLAEFGLEAVHRTTPSGYIDYGKFHVLYGRALQGDISERDIEEHSRLWLDKSFDIHRGMLRAATEAEVIAQQCQRHGMLYEATIAHLCVMRMIIHCLYNTADQGETELLQRIHSLGKQTLNTRCSEYVLQTKQAWIDAGRDMARAIRGTGTMITYLVHCARILELSGCLYFIQEDASKRAEVISFLVDFLSKEPGCGHIPSDRYAVSLVLPVIALRAEGKSSLARKLIQSSVLWLCDRYQVGDSLGSLADDPYTEITSLLGHAFDFIEQHSSPESYLATILCDLAAFLDDKQFYSDVVNDVKASSIVPQYWQAPDTGDLCSVEGSSIITYPSIEYQDSITSYDQFQFAEHIVHEPRTFRAIGWTDAMSMMGIVLLLRDRHFPTVWPLLAG